MRWQGPLAAGVPLVELRGADGAGLEERFLQLTADAQREETSTSANLTNGAVV